MDRHRHPKSHVCSPPLVQEEPKNKAALKLLEKHFPSTNATPLSSRRTIPKIPTDPAKLAKYHKVEMMKLRHHAKPGDPSKSNGDVPVDDRLHVKVSVDTSTDEKALWFIKNIITGKALDCLAKQFGLPRPTGANPLQLYLRALTEPDTPTELPNDKPLSLLVADGSSLFITTTTKTFDFTG
ncbi:hypothetical protein EYR40_001152 [Pleurotus pulmonarius]|nr:hypothetical protein EYR38_004393 [Pleurotus pulmonarius]KAF4608805.1 hypothetical protein EYR40_001152 [Pleurotus pulmonarius]